MMKKRVIIVGSGPAGLFGALELSRDSGIEVCIFEKKSRCGGAGTNSDGKLVLSGEVGGEMPGIIGQDRFHQLMGVVDRTFTRFGGEQKIYEKNYRKIKKLVETAASFDMHLIPTKTRHFGSDNAPEIVKNIKEELEKRGVKIYLNTPVESVEKKDKVFLVKTGGKDPKEFESDYVIVATGRDRTGWWVELAKNLGLNTIKADTYDFGVRVEVPEYVFKPVTDYLYDPKFVIYKTKCTGDKVRTFCVCPKGQVITETESGLTLVNGHSFEKDSSRKTNNTNFAILVSTVLKQGFDKPFEFARNLSMLGNYLAVEGKVLVQRLGDLTAPQERRSYPERIEEIKDFIVPTLKTAFPGDIGHFIPYRPMRSILEMLERLNNMVPGISSDHTLLYAPEAKFYSNRVESSQDLETKIEGLFAVGDGAGITRGIMHASISGIVAAQAILKRCRN
ncbi:MAG: FAD-dependent oxidoreductase [Candidatus Nealsonbacteria bacterium]|nr:FAD-dependent oxidoreductase [Candidatus Nealsonbacteria bacterium]